MNTMQEAIKNAGVRKAIAESEKAAAAANPEVVKERQPGPVKPIVHKEDTPQEPVQQAAVTEDTSSGEPKVFRGKVKWFMVSKGYGFIVDEDGNDVFVHFTGINNGRTYKALEQDDVVEFELTEGKSGIQASNVNIVSAVTESN